ncbi:MAG TPA: sugar ABC transporter substrate-binding protein [Streptosporangiaceae bacterium]|jgi:ribose transport system substrate-binding protein
MGRADRDPRTAPLNPLRELAERPTKAKVDSVLDRLDTRGVGRRQFVRLAAASVAAIGAGGALAACGKSSGSASTSAASDSLSGVAAVTDGQVAMLAWAQGNEYPVEWAQGHIGACDQLGLKSVMLDGRFDAGLQMNQFQELLTQSTTGIVIGANDPGAIPVMAKQTNSQQVFFSNAWNQPPWYTPWDSGGLYDKFLLPDDTIAVAKTIDLLAQEIGQKGTIVRVAGIKGATAENLSYAGTLNALKKYPNIKLAGQLYGIFQADASEKVTATLLSRYPDTVGVLAVDDDGALGVVAAIKAAGKVPGKDIFVVGADATSGGVKMIKDGDMLATTGSTPSYPGYVTVTSFYDRLHGWKPNEAERTFGWHSTIITKDNVDAYQARYTNLPPSKHFSAVKMSRIKSPKDWDLQYDAYPIEDLQTIWPLNPKPAGYKYPALYLKAQRDGEFDKIRKLYADHYHIQVLDPSPVTS